MKVKNLKKKKNKPHKTPQSSKTNKRRNRKSVNELSSNYEKKWDSLNSIPQGQFEAQTASLMNFTRIFLSLKK